MTSDNEHGLALLDHEDVPVNHELKAPVSADASKFIDLFSRQLSVHTYIPDASKEDAQAEQQSHSVQAQAAIHDESAAISEFLLLVATVPGALAGKFYFEQSRLLHKQLLDDILRDDNGVYHVSILVQYNIDHKVVLRDSFSNTENWGLEPNFYIIVKGTQDMVRGVAALLGAVFGQNSVGICSRLNENDLNTWKSSRSQTLPNDVHRGVTVCPEGKGVIMTSTRSQEIIEIVRKKFKDLSGQLDMYGRSIEFHDFGSCIKHLNSAAIQKILRKNYSQPYRVCEFLGKSTLLEENDYEAALNKSCLDVGGMIACIKLARKHAVLFSCK